VKRWLMAVALGGAVPVFAQPAEQPKQVEGVSCEAEEAALEREMDLARSRGQMLRRRQLAETLAALRTRCHGSETRQSRAARIDKLEQEIRTLRSELERAEDQLRDLRNERP
jgi:predicted  nucleic acid-binding Zn-ribbon protein